MLPPEVNFLKLWAVQHKWYHNPCNCQGCYHLKWNPWNSKKRHGGHGRVGPWTFAEARAQWVEMATEGQTQTNPCFNSDVGRVDVGSANLTSNIPRLKSRSRGRRVEHIRAAQDEPQRIVARKATLSTYETWIPKRSEALGFPSGIIRWNWDDAGDQHGPCARMTRTHREV